jgi:NAD(P)H-flavin reductase
VHQAAEHGKKFRIKDKKWLSDRVFSMWVEAPPIAASFRPGQFVVVRAENEGLQIPLCVAEVDKERTQIRLLVPVAGYSARLLSLVRSSEQLADITGPVGRPLAVEKHEHPVLGVAEEVGAAFLLPHLIAQREAGNRVSVILGASTLKQLVLVDELQKVAHDLHLSTDEGVFVRKGPVTDVLIELLNKGFKPAMIFAVGPPAMMKLTSEIAARRGIPVTTSINPVLVDGAGTCGGCRISVGGKTCYACVDGPDFDGTKVDWEDLMARVDKYRPQDAFLWDQACKIIHAGG